MLFDLPPPQDPTLAKQLGDPGITNVLGQFQSNELKEDSFSIGLVDQLFQTARKFPAESCGN